MSNTDSLQGPLTVADLQAVWEGAVDRSYREPLIAAGEGGGFEVYTQAFEQVARLSQAVDRTTQQMYLLPWSGQSDVPASGPANATVELTITRAGYLGRPLVLMAGQIAVDEQQLDHGAAGGVLVDTGRRYVLQETAVFAPGDVGPVQVSAQAAKPGYGYNNPLPGSISFVENSGTGLHNDGGTLTKNAGAALGQPASPALSYTLLAANVTDMPVPGNVGQFVLFTGGSNVGATALVSAFLAPNVPATTPPSGSGLVLVPLCAFESFSVNHVFLVGGFPVWFIDHSSALCATGILLAVETSAAGTKFLVQIQQGDTANAMEMFQTQRLPLALASAAVSIILSAPALTPEAGTASWRVLDWARDWQITVSNAASPTGGALGMLDLHGAERDLPRQAGEQDDPYRDRVATIADVVTPNAIKRALYRALGSLPWCYRETGNGMLPGFFYDRTGDEDGDFYDDDMLLWKGNYVGTWTIGQPISYQRQVPSGSGPWLTLASGVFGGFYPISTGHGTLKMIRQHGDEIAPLFGDRILNVQAGEIFTPLIEVVNDFAVSRRWHVYLDYAQFRAFFLVEVSRVNAGEFGFAYDDHPLGAYDAAPYWNFYDGFPPGESSMYRALYAQLDKIRASGVSFELVPSSGPCA